MVAEFDMEAAKLDAAPTLHSPAKAGGDGFSRTTLTGGLIAGLLASACCVGPLALVMLGISGAWISNLTLLEPYRWIFIGIALVFMALAWRRIYRAPAAVDCEPGTVCALPQTNRVYRVMFWVVSALVLLGFAFPYIAPLFY
ncbi:MAG: mercuric ion transporter MerT [Geminicoccales bacterium]